MKFDPWLERYRIAVGLPQDPHADSLGHDEIAKAKQSGWRVKKQREGWRLHAAGGSFWPCRTSEVAAWMDLPKDWVTWVKRG